MLRKQTQRLRAADPFAMNDAKVKYLALPFSNMVVVCFGLRITLLHDLYIIYKQFLIFCVFLAPSFLKDVAEIACLVYICTVTVFVFYIHNCKSPYLQHLTTS